MKLDSRHIRYLTADDWRVLTAVEMGSRNHECVPVSLITEISGLRGASGVSRAISSLAKIGLIGKLKNAKYEGYRLSYGGLDYLALNAHRKHNTLFSVGTRVGVGKESDIYVAASPDNGGKRILKIHRLGRISFRQVKNTRDYLRGRSAKSWMYMSRLAAMKEHAFMSALHGAGFPVPEPIAQNRHTVVMSLIDGTPLRQISSVPDPAGLMDELIAIAMRLARYGLIHGDFNEFNIMIEEIPSDEMMEDGEPKIILRPVVIDFPQMVSIDHPNAEYYFDRDIACIKRFFERRFHLINDVPGPTFADAIADVGKDTLSIPRLDVQVEASGFSRKMAKELEAYMKEVGVDGDNNGSDVGGEDDQDADSDGGNEDEVEEESEDEEAHMSSKHETNEPEEDVEIPLHDEDIPEPLIEVQLEDIPVQPKKTQRKKAAGWSI